MEPVRSLLYVPASNDDWVATAPEKYPADAIIFDLEDAVTPSEKPAARQTLRDQLPAHVGRDTVISVRINPVGSAHFEEDLQSIVRDGLDAVVVPKLATRDQVTRVDSVLTFLERTRNIENSIEIIALPETALGFRNTYELCRASDRVASIVGGATRGADVNRALGFEWTQEGLETLHLRSKVLLDARAAGLDQIFSGVYADVDDVDGLRNEAKFARQLGYTGYKVIHPKHLEPVNEIFTPEPSEVEYYRELLKALEEAKQEGQNAVRYQGEMIDEAHAKTAERVVARARAFGVIE
jgi:citrate lyase subunit beta/citryl-CoA lyase